MRILNRAALVIDGLVNRVLVVAIVIILLVSGYSYWDNLYLYRSAQDTSLLTYKPVLDKPLLIYDEAVSDKTASGAATSGDRMEFVTGLPGQVGWISLYNTNVDYPIMQGANNFEYLNKDPYGAFKLSGSIFLDFRSDSLLQDPYSVIYGHHMEHGSMFGSLEDYLDRAYFDAHRNGRITTGDAVYQLTLFAVTYADGNDRTFFDPEGRTREEILDYLVRNAIFFESPQEGLNLVALTTCYGEEYISRLAVVGTIQKL